MKFIILFTRAIRALKSQSLGPSHLTSPPLNDGVAIEDELEELAVGVGLERTRGFTEGLPSAETFGPAVATKTIGFDSSPKTGSEPGIEPGVGIKKGSLAIGCVSSLIGGGVGII